MGTDEVLCEYCGLYSSSGFVCQNCGKPLDGSPPEETKFARPRWGRLSIRIFSQDIEGVGDTLRAALVKLERRTEQSLLPSQAGKIQAGLRDIELYVSEFSATALEQEIGSKAVVTFQELPDEELPTK